MRGRGLSTLVVVLSVIMGIHCKYLNIRFTAIQCVLVGFELNFATLFTAKAISGWVCVN